MFHKKKTVTICLMAKKKKTIIFLAVILILFFTLRLIHLQESISFGSDAGRDFLKTWHIYTTKQVALIGPPSEYTIQGRQFFFGPAPYYIILPALLIGNWDPLVVSYFLIFLNAAVLIAALIILNKYIKETFILYCFALFCTTTPAFIHYSQSYWNPYLMLPTSILLLAILVAAQKKPQHSPLLFSIIGFLFGLGLQFHYSFILAIIVSILCIGKYKKLGLVSTLALIGGFIVGFLPMIIFEVRNHFYNIDTLLLIVKNSENSHSKFTFAEFYFISLLPFLFFLVSILLVKLYKKQRWIAYAFGCLYFIWSLSVIIPVPKYLFNYPMLQTIAKKIQADKPTNFNIVDQLTRDNQATALRYLLTVYGFAPNPVDQYQSSQTIYIYSKEPLNTLIKDPVYEIKSFLPFKKVETLKLENNLSLYRLIK